MVHIVGHRGASGHVPENTLQSFRKAIELGCHRTELDVRMSSDGQLVVIHDESVDRTTDGSGLVSSMSASDLQELKCDDGQRIPLLQEVIDLCAGRIDLMIELKAEGTPAAVHDMITANGIEQTAIVSSFKIELLQEIRKMSPQIRLLFLFREAPEDLWKTAEELSLEYIGPKAKIVTRELVLEAHERGLLVYSYHTNTEKRGDKAVKRGVDAIGTKFPELFL